MGFGTNLKKLLKDNNMTIKELSQKTGISINTLYAITKRDSENVRVSTLLKIAEVLNISTTDLLGYDIEESDYSSINNARLYEAKLNADKRLNKNKAIETIAAHFDGTEFTDTELDDIANYVEFVKSKKS